MNPLAATSSRHRWRPMTRTLVLGLVRRKIRFIAIKEAIEFDGKQDLRTKVMIALFGLFAEVERDLISERTKEGLAAAKAKGKLGCGWRRSCGWGRRSYGS